MENDLIFVGLLIMENKLKEVTKSVIQNLKAANVKTIMVTGDNALTAISVARQCDIVDHKKRVFLGDFSEKKNEKVIVWKDLERGKRMLD